MPDLSSLAVFVVAGLLLNLTPGPDVFYIVGRSLSQGRGAGIASALGIGAGCLFHIITAACGLAALLSAMPLAFAVVRYAGAAYLVWLGVKALRSGAPAFEPDVASQQPLRSIFWQGVVTNILNPKVALFFVAFLPQFTDPAGGSLGGQVLMLGLIFNFNGTLVNIGYALVASRLGDWLKSRFDLSRWLNRVTGALFIALGLRLAFFERRN